MKLISLNIWGGKEYAALRDFIEQHKDSTDIFCFQEVYRSTDTSIVESRGIRAHLFDELQALLPDHRGVFYPMQKNFDLKGQTSNDIEQGLATFIRRSIPILAFGEVFTRGTRDSATKDSYEDYPSAFGYVRIPFKNSTLAVLNFYGLPIPGHKLDTAERLEQSRLILEFIAKEKGEVILTGDFNLMPETESIRMFVPRLKNLITKFGITMTRSKINPYYGTPEQQNFADYTFVSKGLTVKSFEVPEDCVASDHLPMILEFD